jgi:hypothetical protein
VKNRAAVRVRARRLRIALAVRVVDAGWKATETRWSPAGTSMRRRPLGSRAVESGWRDSSEARQKG